jgi:hypothetical protein
MLGEALGTLHVQQPRAALRIFRIERREDDLAEPRQARRLVELPDAELPALAVLVELVAQRADVGEIEGLQVAIPFGKAQAVKIPTKRAGPDRMTGPRAAGRIRT